MNTYQFDSTDWIDALAGTRLETFAQALAQAVSLQGNALKHGHLPAWNAAIEQLPAAAASGFDIIDGAINITIANANNSSRDKDDNKSDNDNTPVALHSALRGLMPWRKGPYRFGPVFIDTEWRSDWKWNRLAPHVSELKDRTVLDVGCGNGYHLWRMRHAGARTVLGIDPSLLYVKQFEATQHFIKDSSVQLLPLPMHALPANMRVFDTVFSMGVLYHRRDPMEHLQELKAALRVDGELVLETLVIPGKTDESLIIDGRYANMRNIYELPTTTRLSHWLKAAGFTAIKLVDVTQTSRQEQRSTTWMTSHSLAQALDPDDPLKTVEGHPRPLRAVILARPAA